MAPPRKGRLEAANKTFVDRERPQKVFEDAAFAIPADRAIVRCFYGVGGQGKTALCRELIRKTKPGVDPSLDFLRCSELDLHDRQKTDPDRLLVWIRNSFADAGVAFPCFDLAFAITWEETRGEEPFPKLSKPWLGKATKYGESGVESAVKPLEHLIVDGAEMVVGELVSSLPGFGFMLKRVGNWAIATGKRAYLERTKEPLKELYRGGDLKKPYELSRLLPWMLAQDLNAHLADNPERRFVLFVDEYERVFDEGGAGTRWEENPFDTHMRTLLQETNGLLAVFFSRERLPWGAHPDWRADLADAQHLLGGLGDRDAEAFLTAIPIEDGAIRRAIIDGARETSEQGAPVYPLMLDLQVEHWRTLRTAGEAFSAETFQVEAESFESRRLEIVRRVLRDYGAPLQTTLERLAVARRFDRQAFAHVVQNFGTALPLDQFGRIADLSFVSASDNGFLTLHNAIAETIRESLDDERRLSSIDSLFGHFEARAELVSTGPVTEENVIALVEAAFLRRSKGLVGYAEWLKLASERFARAGRVAHLLPLWHEAAADAEAELGADSLDLAICLRQLGNLQQGRIDFDDIRALYERALPAHEKVLGEEHTDTIELLGDLASAIHDQSNLDAARALYEKALGIRERRDGPDNPGNVTTINNLALVMKHQGEFNAALPLYERALAIWEKAFGPDYGDLAGILVNIGYLLMDQGKYTEARPYLDRALAVSESAAGPEHPMTAVALNTLGLLLRYQGDYAGSEPFFLRALAIREKVLGPEHIETTTAYNNLAQLYQNQGRYAEARPLFERTLEVREKTFGADSFATSIAVHNLACLLHDMGELAAAKPLLERAISMREGMFDPDDMDIAPSIGRLGLVLVDMGEPTAARPHLERTLAITSARLGPEHPSSANSMGNLAACLTTLGETGKAQDLLDQAISASDKVLGEEHPTSQRLRCHWARLLLATGRNAEARVVAAEAVARLTEKSGVNHTWTRAAAKLLAEVEAAPANA